jgi:RNA polymerase sigma-70 factor (ECF subfamily)
LDFSQPAARFVAHHQLTRCIPVHHPKPLARSKPLMHETSELIACKGLAIIGPATLQLCSSPGMIFASICGYGNLQKIGNFFHLPPSNPMSSLSGAHDEIETPPSGVSVAQQAEADLLRRAQFGDRAAFGQIVLRFQDRLYNSILRLVGDVEEARDLTQETFTRALVKIESFRGEAGPYTWLFRIAVNLAISQLRKVQKHRVFSLDAASGGNGQTSRRGDEDQASALVDRVAETRGVSPAEQSIKREQGEQVLAALGRLDAEYRAVLVMRDVEGFDYQQMADVLGLPLGTLKSRLFRARLALRDELKAYLK